RQFRTYPSTSTMCTDAVDACHRAFLALRQDDAVAVRITSEQVLLNDDAIAADTAIDQELRRPLHAAHVATLEFERGAGARDWAQFCLVVAAARRAAREAPTFAERLMDAGVNAIIVRMTPRPEVLDFPDLPDATRRLIAHERQRQASAPDTPAQYLYPPDKGWVRVDPTADDASVSLTDLTLLANDPEHLASILARLVDDAVDGGEEAAPLCGRYDDVVTLIGAIEPRLGRMLMAKLARAVLDLDIDRRRALLRRSILPHLLDGRVDGEAVLAEFPDVALAEALGLLLDLEMASPQLVPMALDRLQLAPDRRQRMMPLVDAARGEAPAAHGDRWTAAGFDDQARKLVDVDGKKPRHFGDFAAFDLSIDDSTRAAIADARTAITTTDSTDVWLASLLRLAAIEPNPGVVASLVERALPELQAFARTENWPELVRWLARVSDTAAAVAAARPDVADAIRDVLQRFCNRDTVLRLANLCVGPESARACVPHVVSALGANLVPAWLDALASPTERAAAMRLRPALCDCAVEMAPAIAPRLPDLRADVAAVALTVLGFAGVGHEADIAARIDEGDEALGREALRALARIASPRAASIIASQIERGGA